MTKQERIEIIDLIHTEVVLAIGCTEPIAVALCTAKATETLGCLPQQITARLSPNILKNAMGVGIPGTGMIGLPIAIALGALIGKSEYGLEVLRDCTPKAVEDGKRIIEQKRIEISTKTTPEVLYAEVECRAGDNVAIAVISGTHTHFSYIEHNGKMLVDAPYAPVHAGAGQEVELSMQKVYDFATTAPIDEIEFLLDTAKTNRAAAEASLKGDYGHALGKVLRGEREQHVLSDCTFSHILSYTAAACDARMAGAMISVMSNSGSGNQGISATVPVLVYAEDNHKSTEDLIRALALSHLTVIYIKQSLGRLSALCGCVVAATGSSCGLTYLMGGGYDQITYAVKNMVANLTGMICDGAKPSCALKVASGVSTAVLSAMLAMEDKHVTALEGIVDDDVDQCIRNLTRIGTQGMTQTDGLILDIMTHKKNIK